MNTPKIDLYPCGCPVVCGKTDGRGKVCNLAPRHDGRCDLRPITEVVRVGTGWADVIVPTRLPASEGSR